ncbi:MAG: hypothetical protein KF788_22095 [Piscinibacter sp.]|nr:hypothetical protein [Piscinibacter sp.]
MRRRTLLQLGLGSAITLAVVGGGLALVEPGLDPAGRLHEGGRRVMHGVARGVLDGVLPREPAALEAALLAHLRRLDDTLTAFPPATRSELSQLFALLASTPGRLALAGLTHAWDEADAASIQAALQAMRTSGLALRQQAYHALRDLTNAAWFAEPSSWSALGYGGPVDL